MTIPHVPQIPSRQSLSNAIGSSPFNSSSSFTTSSISRKDMCSLASVSYVTKPPRSDGDTCRQT